MARSAPCGRDAQRPVAGAEMRNDNGSHPRRKVPARGSRDTRRQGTMRRRACLVVLVLAGPASGTEPFVPDSTSPPAIGEAAIIAVSSSAVPAFRTSGG